MCHHVLCVYSLCFAILVVSLSISSHLQPPPPRYRPAISPSNLYSHHHSSFLLPVPRTPFPVLLQLFTILFGGFLSHHPSSSSSCTYVLDFLLVECNISLSCLPSSLRSPLRSVIITFYIVSLL
ncbi:hypothetical protein SISSUDRAFT_1052635 [Sistotremastrum suecicum HHB10207 ss-3]|uniref:Uncharacterized protein n=1 Tax=Sistotremastrum suecicum HHB10207 ss-3 TaxID=1314776 RepID=A0A165ZQT8_9AGAM|nr:hypothetical protein SISSUDRAFT_1052635 [Sistotremastrum suecicum HHB10207 ss-3]